MRRLFFHQIKSLLIRPDFPIALCIIRARFCRTVLSYTAASYLQRTNWKNNHIKSNFLLTFLFQYDIINKSSGHKTRRGIEAVITRRSWKPFGGNATWVRIPSSPFFIFRGTMQWWCIDNWIVCFRSEQSEYPRGACSEWMRRKNAASADVGFIRRRQQRSIFRRHGEVPKLAEGTPLERVQGVNSVARVQIPPSPFNSSRKRGLFFYAEIMYSENISESILKSSWFPRIM